MCKRHVQEGKGRRGTPGGHTHTHTQAHAGTDGQTIRKTVLVVMSNRFFFHDDDKKNRSGPCAHIDVDSANVEGVGTWW